MTTAETSTPATRGGWSAQSVWVLFLLTMISIFNFADRAIVSIVQEPIKHEFKLSDGDLGVLNGLAFVVLYAVIGLPLARMADVWSRKSLLSIVATIWSGMSALCAATTGFGQLLVARVFVGAAELPASPISLSLISDYFPMRLRGQAVGFYSSGIPLGVLLAATVGGLVAHQWGWRAAFIAVGAPGVVFGLLVGLTVREPERGRFDNYDASEAAPNLAQTAKALLRQPTYVHLLIGSAATGISIYGLNAFVASFYIREHGLNLAQMGLLVGVGQGVAGFIGTITGGWLADRNSATDVRPYMTVPGYSLLGSAVFFGGAFYAPNFLISAACLIAAYFCSGLKSAPSWAATQNLANPRARAIAAAIVTLTITVVGQGLGPTVIGFLSDHLATGSFPHALGAYKAMCPGGQPLPADAARIGGACRQASAAGLQGAFLLAIAVYLWGAVHFFVGARTVQKDMGLA